MQEAIGEIPGPIALLNPLHQLHWIWAFAECWIFSRDFGRLLRAVPCLIAAALSIGFAWWLKYSPDELVLDAYLAAIEQTTEDGDDARRENYLRALVSLRPTEPKFRLMLGTFLADHGRREGLSHIVALTPNETEGYAPARRWLVQQALKPNPLLPLTDEQIEGQLRKIVLQFPDDAESRLRLADLYLRRSDWKLAEEHLGHVAMTHPELCVEVAKLKQTLRRDRRDIESLLNRGAEEFLRRLQRNPADLRARISLAEAQLLLGQEKEARLLLESGLAQYDEPTLRRALSDFDVTIARRRLGESDLNVDQALSLLLKALETDPANPVVISELNNLDSKGIRIPRNALESAVNVWRSASRENPDDHDSRLVLALVEAMTGDYDSSISTLEPLLDSRPELRLAQAQHLQRAGRTDEGLKLLDQVILDLKNTLIDSPGDNSSRSRLATALTAADRAEDALKVLSEAQLDAAGRIPADPALRAQFGQMCLLLYDARVPPQQPITAETVALETEAKHLLELLRDAFGADSTAIPALDRLARLTFSKHPIAENAAEVVAELRAMGDPGGRILTVMGTRAIMSENYPAAIKWLEQANSQTRGQEPMILNNLAIALVRGSTGRLVYAGELIDRALQILPDHPDLLSTRGEVFVAMKRWKEAVVELNRALPHRTDSLVVHRLLQRVYTELNDTNMAHSHREVISRLEQAIR